VTDDIRDINATSHSVKAKHRKDENYYSPDSLLAEILFSIIMGITVLSCMMIIKSYVELIEVGMYAQFVNLILVVILTLIRRIKINKFFPVLLMHIAASVVFYFLVINIPVLQYGNSTANRLFFGATLTALTILSLARRLKPSFSCADAELIVFPALIHTIFYILYLLAGFKENANNLLVHVIIIAILFIIMRQIAVFDTKLYHTMHRSNIPSALLKKQNNKTIAGLVVVFAVALGVLAVFPVDLVSGGIIVVIRAVFRLLFLLFKPRESETEIDLEEDPWAGWGDLGPEGQFNPIIDIIGKIVVFLVIIGVIFLIVNMLRILIINAPKYKKESENTDDGVLFDTVENIKPEKQSLITKRHDFGSGYERRIRKQFYDKTRRAIRKGLPVSSASTPGQIGSVISDTGDRNINTLIQEYEKVRYGKRGE